MTKKHKPPAKRFSPADKRAILETIAASGNLKSSIASLGFSPTTLDKARKADPQFDEAVRMSLAKANLELEQEARRRAVTGVKRKKYYKDQEIGEEIEYSDRLLMFLMQATDPDKYGKKGGSTNVNIQQNISTTDKDSTLSKLGNFLKIDINAPSQASSESDSGDIIDGEYQDIPEQE